MTRDQIQVTPKHGPVDYESPEAALFAMVAERDDADPADAATLLRLAAKMEGEARADFDPNGSTEYTVEVTLGLWRARASFSVGPISSDCGAWEAMAAGVDQLLDDITGEDGMPQVTLVKPDGGDLICVPDCPDELEWLRGMVIGVRVMLYDLSADERGPAYEGDEVEADAPPVVISLAPDVTADQISAEIVRRAAESPAWRRALASAARAL